MSVKFNLKTEKPPCLIVLVFRKGNNKFQYSTGEKIHPKAWDKSRCRARVNKQTPGAASLNDMLDAMERTCQDAYRGFIRNRYGDKKPPQWKALKIHLKAALDSLLLFADVRKEITLFEFIRQFIEERSISPEFSPGTVKVYKTCFNHLKKFSRQNGKVSFLDIDVNFSLAFRQYLYSIGNSTNYANKMLQQVKVFMNAARARGLTDHAGHSLPGFQVAKLPVETIYLSLDELSELQGLALSTTLTRIRDLFLVGCFTGLRYSDLVRVKPSHISDGLIKITTQKTKQPVSVPLAAVVLSIFDKYGGRLPDPISNQKFNQYIKEICKTTAWGKVRMWRQKNVGGRQVSEQIEKYKMVTTHTMRRSFATNAYLEGVPTLDIMKITGHKTESELMKYIRITSEQSAQRLTNHNFFN